MSGSTDRKKQSSSTDETPAKDKDPKKDGSKKPKPPNGPDIASSRSKQSASKDSKKKDK
jgi:hypothetical protein